MRILTDDDELQMSSQVKEKNENARKSGRANKGKNSRSIFNLSD